KGAEGVEAVAALEDADFVVCGLVGVGALRSVLAAVECGHDVALATKEVLVAAGGLLTASCARHGTHLLPVDSEHSAIFQCLEGRLRNGQAAARTAQIRRLILTASGGPFGTRPNVDLSRVTVEEALSHPRWRMGRKVTIDSATLMNKGLEIIEASWFFGVPVEKIDVVIHPESIVHSMVEFVDGSVIAQLSPPDMRYAIQYALTYPDRVGTGLPSLDLTRVGTLHFEQPDVERFPCLGLAREAALRGGTMPAVLNAANEVAVQRFLAGEISFPGIWYLVREVMAAHDVSACASLEAILEADRWAREKAVGLQVK
ncbi:MAG: 1-deoxy-D-xylulose-5-phosphate reductoisomerase, partial [Kiritimatiellae bacterium]|nr:1-deoxy-D-xylulose-5-phosphate reductoisomerase [Kiritimatiellia bacterium]